MKKLPKQEKINYQKSVTKTGIRIVSEKISYVRSASIGVWIDVGSRDEDSSNNGISHFIEHLTFKGTNSRNARSIAQSLESVGGYLNAFTSKEHTCFYARVLDEYLEKALDVLSDLIVNPAFHPKEIEKEKTVILDELKNYEDEPDDLIHDAFENSLFSPHPLGFSILGTVDNIKKFSRKTVLKFKESYYTGNNIVISATGNIDHDNLVNLVNKYFSKIKISKNDVLREKAEHKKSGYSQQIEKPIHQAHLCMGTYAYTVKDPKRYPLLILNTLLGDGMSSRLYQTIREKHGLAYSVYSFANLMSDTGIFGIYLGTDKDNLKTSSELIYKEIHKLKTKSISKSELDRTKSQVKGGLVLGLENMSNRMMRLGRTEIYYEDYFEIDSIIKKIDNVKIDEILDVASEVLNDDHFSSVSFIPKA